MRILITRPQAEAERTAARLIALGHEPVIAPVLRIERTEDTPPSGSFDALIVTSVNAVPALADLEDGRAPPVFAVGARTAAAVAAEGFADVRAGGGGAAALAALIAKSLNPGARLLHIAGRDRKPELALSLAEAGFQIEVWAAYAAQAAKRLPDAARNALRDSRLDAALHYSRRSVTIVLDLVRTADLTHPFLALDHLCLSPDAAAPLREAGGRRIIAAERPDEEALLAKFNRGGSNRTGRRSPRPGGKDGTNSPAPASLSSSPPEGPIVTDTPPDTSNSRPRRTGPYREPPTIDLKATVIPDEPARRDEAASPASATPDAPARREDVAKPAEEPQLEAALSPPSEPVAADPSGSVSEDVKADSPSTEASATGIGPALDGPATAGTSGEVSDIAAADVPPAKSETLDEAPDLVASQALPAVEEPRADRATMDAAEAKSAPEDHAVTEAAEAQAETAGFAEQAPPPPKSETRRGLGAGALLGTGLLGGLVGAGLTMLGQTYWNPSRSRNDPRLEQLEQRLGSTPSREAVSNLERRLTALDAEQKSLNDRLRAAQQLAESNPRPAQESASGGQTPASNPASESAPAERAPDLTPALAALTARFSMLEADVRELAPVRDQAQANLEATRSLDQRLSALQGQIQASVEAGNRALDQRLTAALGQVRDQLRDQMQANAEATRTLERRFADQDQRLTALAQRVGDRNPAEVATAALRVTLADRVGSALRAGSSLGPALEALRRLDIDPQALAALEPYAAQGAPSAAALAQSFKPLGDRIIAESRPASSNANWSDRLWRMADQVVTVRAVSDAGGNDAPSLVARIQTALANGSLRDAAAAWDALPEPARRLSDDWGRRLKQQLAAEEAVQKIADRALSALDATTR